MLLTLPDKSWRPQLKLAWTEGLPVVQAGRVQGTPCSLLAGASCPPVQTTGTPAVKTQDYIAP